jgi:hypothetical protein
LFTSKKSTKDEEEENGRIALLVKTNKESPLTCKIPAIQEEQAEDDVAPVTAEYVPAKASDERYGEVHSKTSSRQP